MNRLLITGASGTLGRNLARIAQRQGWEVSGTYYTAPPPQPGHWRRLDVSDRAAVMALVRAVQPAAIVHTAFLNRGASMWATTADGAAFVALAAQQVGARLVHVSSDAVFDETKNPYTETDKPSPITPYGAAKAAAETAASAIDPRAAIVRTTLIISREPLDPHTRFVLDIATGARAGQLFTDQFRCPIGADDLAGALLELAANDFAGVIHVAGAEALSRYEFGRLVADAYHLDPARLSTTTVAAHSSLSAPVIADIRLDSTLARSLLKTRLRGMSEWLSAAP